VYVSIYVFIRVFVCVDKMKKVNNTNDRVMRLWGGCSCIVRKQYRYDAHTHAHSHSHTSKYL
jgi:hypothetical protein